jgi:hypothetical protein
MIVRLLILLATGALLAKSHDERTICEMVCMPGQFEKLDKCKPDEKMIFESNGTCPAKGDKCAPGFQARKATKPPALKDCAEAKCRSRCKKA